MEQRVQFGVSDPWEFGEQNGQGPFSAAIEDSAGDLLLLRLDAPIVFEGLSVTHFVASPRHAHTGFSEIGRGRAVPANLTPVVPAPRTTRAAFDDARSWRGWHLIGGVRATVENS